MRVMSAAARAAMKAKKAAKAAEKAAQKNLGGDTATRGKPKDTPQKAEADRKAAAARSKERKRQENIRTSESKSSINKSRNVSKADRAAADDAEMIRTMQKRIDDMPSGTRKKMMQGILDRQEAGFEDRLRKEFNSMVRKQQQSASDRKPFKGYTPVSPFNRGGMAKRKNYKDGGYANCGASMKPTQGKK